MLSCSVLSYAKFLFCVLVCKQRQDIDYVLDSRSKMGRFRTVMAGIGGMAVVGGTGMIIYQNMFMDRHAIVSFFLLAAAAAAQSVKGPELRSLKLK